jgi:hypothetical protein
MSSFLKKKQSCFTVICIITFMMLGSFVSSFGQHLATGITVDIPDTVLRVNNKELRDITVHVTNNDNVPFVGYLYLHTGKGAKIATKDSVALKIEPGKEAYVPSKIYINQGTVEGSIPVLVQVRDNNGLPKDSLTLRLVLIANKLLTVLVEEENMVLPKVGDDLRIPIRLSNRGNVSQGGVLVIAFPSALRDNTNKSIPFVIDPFKDTIIVFERKVTRDMARLGRMNVTINGIYNDDGNIFGSNLVSIQNLSSRRSYEESLGEKTFQHTNFITLGVQNAFDAGENYYIRSRGDYGIKDGRVSYNFNINKWKAPSESFSVNGTNLDISYKQVGARLGNITQNGDLSFTGRGGELFAFLDSAKSKKVFGGYLDKSINLIANENFGGFGNASWVGYRQETQSMLSMTTFSHDLDNITQTRSELLVSNLAWKVNDHLSADIKAGAANSTSTSGNNESFNSMTAGLNFYGTFFKNLNISGNNSFATGYYPGTRRGTLYLNEGVFWRINKSTLSGTVIYSDAVPQYMNQPSLVLQSRNKSTTGDLTYNLRFGAASLGFSSQYYTESGNWYYNNATTDGNMSSVRVSTLFTYNPVKSQQTLYFKTDIGTYQSNLDGRNKLQLRSMLTYNYKNFRLLGNIQKGNFYLSDVFQEYFTGFNSFRLNIAPSMTTYFFDKSLKWDAGIAYNRDFYSNSFLLNTNLALIVGSTAFFTNVQYNIYSNSRSYKNIQFGVSYFLPENDPNKNRSKSKIEVFVFYDLNRNGVYDKTDSIASGIIVNIGKTILMSGKDGRVVYSKLPPGNYSVYLPTQNGWYGHDRFITLHEKDSKFYSIPLNQTGTVHGNISYQFDSTFSFSVTRDKAWQSIVAINEEGKRFETKTDETGNYHLYLPVGTYTIIVDKLPNQIELLLKNNNVQPLKVASGQIITNVDFILKVKQRKVEIKKFGQQK